MPAAVRSRSRAALMVAAALLVTGCAVAAPGAENDEWIEQSMGEDLDAGELDAELIDPGMLEPPIDPGSIVPPFGSVAGLSGGAAGGTTGEMLPMMPRDASTAAPRDASTAAPRDAAAARPPTTAPRDAGRPATGTAGGAAASCNVLTCTNTCSVAGPFPCCGLLGCGCTWAPGAYCL
jgi:hypothetical protein